MMEINKIHEGDCVEVLKTFPDNYFDSIVTDPPYELGFMGKKWDNSGIAYNIELWKECLRVLKPGGHLLSFGGTRTYHRMACAIEDAGFEIRDMIEWIYGQGFPKSLNIGKSIEKQKGIEMPIGKRFVVAGYQDNKMIEPTPIGNERDKMRHHPITNEGKQWEGWGTALKPSHEPIVMARKPLSEKTIAENVLKHGTGGINIDECRIPLRDNEDLSIERIYTECPLDTQNMGWGFKKISRENEDRFPANLIHDGSEEVLELFPDSKSSGGRIGNKGSALNMMGNKFEKGNPGFGDDGSASRFFYCAKASSSERNEDCEEIEGKYMDDSREIGSLGGTNPRNRGAETKRNNFHPTVKPVALMKYLVKIVTPKKGIVLDPFIGSGTTAIACFKQGFKFIGIEKEPDYVKIANARISDYLKQATLEKW